MEITSIGIGPAGLGLAFAAGVVSFLSPCVLALLPAYLGYLGGRSVAGTGQVVENRAETFSHGIAFVLGFSIIFILGGAFIGGIGALLTDFTFKTWLTRIGGAVIILFGLHTMGVISIPFLNYDTRRQVAPDQRWGYFSSIMMGVFFSAGWAPCVGPVLGAIYTLVLSGGSALTGVLLLSFYSAGMALPFLLAALGVGKITRLMRNHGKIIHALSVGTGVLLIFVGVLLMTGQLERLFAQLAPSLFIDFGL
jgi:cytochrome c-type biogenesis protein